jgi:hypothetical protein
MHVSASLLNFLIDEYPQVFDHVSQVLTGGEAASVVHVERTGCTGCVDPSGRPGTDREFRCSHRRRLPIPRRGTGDP